MKILFGYLKLVTLKLVLLLLIILSLRTELRVVFKI